jgi:hypothetical protein
VPAVPAATYLQLPVLLAILIMRLVMRFRVTLPALATGLAVFVASCTDQIDPATSSDPNPDPSLALRQGNPDDPNGLARAVPGFGGMFFDAQGQATIYLRDAGQRANAERALAPFLQARGIGAARLRVLKGEFDWTQLERWQGSATTEALSVPGAVFVDADEASNRVRIGVERGASGRVRAALARAGLPDAAVIMEEREPITFAVGQGPGPKAKPGSGPSLQGVVRPIIGGVQINFPGYLCTLGFNVGGGSFITNSHCTTTQGGTEGTPYWQPTQSASPSQIATEAADPTYRSSLSGCPSGRDCRFSDASRASYANGFSQFTIGRIAKTDRPGRGLTITGQFTITGEGSATVGEVVNKVGRTTGWSQGSVTNTCVNTNVSGSNITQLCQNFVSATVGSGDSGSPVFQILSGDNVHLVGILWGGSGSQQFVYSPISNIEQELGGLTTQ